MADVAVAVDNASESTAMSRARSRTRTRTPSKTSGVTPSPKRRKSSSTLNPATTAAAAAQSTPQSAVDIAALYSRYLFALPNGGEPRWSLVPIGQGTYSVVFAGIDVVGDSDMIAVKISKSAGADAELMNEGNILHRLRHAAVCHMIHQPLSTDTTRHLTADLIQPHFIAMSLLHTDVSELAAHNTLSPLICCQLSLHMLRTLRSVHAYNVLHRDVKPSNFGLSIIKDTFLQCTLIDFGQSVMLADEYTITDLPTTFKGKSLYASLARHDDYPQGKNDDVVMLLFIFYDLLYHHHGGLPWSALYAHRTHDEYRKDRARAAIRSSKVDWFKRIQSGTAPIDALWAEIFNLAMPLEAWTDQLTADETKRERLNHFAMAEPKYDDIGRTLQRIVKSILTDTNTSTTPTPQQASTAAPSAEVSSITASRSLSVSAGESDLNLIDLLRAAKSRQTDKIRLRSLSQTIMTAPLPLTRTQSLTSDGGGVDDVDDNGTSNETSQRSSQRGDKRRRKTIDTNPNESSLAEPPSA